MNTFKEHQLLHANLDSATLDAGDLNLYSKFPRVSHLSFDGFGHKDGVVYRCHLTDDFLREFNLDFSRDEVSFTSGVRASLKAIADVFSNRPWVIPSDTYPFYQSLLEGKQVEFGEYETLKPLTLPELGNSSVLLMSEPFKPSSELAGTSWWTHVHQWLKDAPEAILIVDAVYAEDFILSEALLSLYSLMPTQVIILTSLSKMMAAPLIAGFAVSRNLTVKDALRKLEKPPLEQLQTAHALLNQENASRRNVVKLFLKEQHAKAVRKGLVPGDSSSFAYLFKSELSFDEHAESGIFTVNPSVYDSNFGGSIISTLGL